MRRQVRPSTRRAAITLVGAALTVAAGCGGTSGILPIKVSKNSDPGIQASSCQLNSSGNAVIVTGTFNPPIPPFPANENDSQMPYVSVSVLDAQGADLTINASNEPNHFGVQAGQSSWQATIYINAGFTPSQCEVALFNRPPTSSSAPLSGPTTTTPMMIVPGFLEQECYDLGGTYTSDSPVLASSQTPYACQYYDAQLNYHDDLVVENSDGTFGYQNALPSPAPFLRGLNQARTSCANLGGALIYADYLSPPEYECTTNGSNGVPVTINPDGTWAWDGPPP
jgi:hypothetical protein